MIDMTSMNIRNWSRMGSRGAFNQALLALFETEERAVVLTADMYSCSVQEAFRTQYADRLYNMGIAEQNMVAVAAGLAREGFVPFAATFATFAVMRSAEQIKICMGYMGLGVKLVGFVSGYSVGILGPTHTCLEDIAVMRAIPNVVILSPADCTATVKATLASARMDAPVYLRLTGSANCPIVYKQDFDFEIGRAITLREGTDISLIATGSMVYVALKAAAQLAESGISAEVVDMHTIRPIDKEAIERACSKKLIVTLEEHSVAGGLGSAVAEVLAGESSRPVQLMLGAEGPYPHAADYPALLENSGLTPPRVAARISQTYKELF
ncbi:transketolase family protein [Desulfovibrio sp.]|uniref:transketolase family protein n=1 Tax=Desulfovibrio sp. TaxID=885 RepID=UPI003FEDA890